MPINCRYCGAEINEYVHSQAGPIKATAWTTVPEDSDEDPRYGTRCPERGSILPHVPESASESEEASEE